MERITMNEIRKAETQADNRPPIVVLRDRLMSRQGELRAALTDVSVEAFIRSVMTSVSLNPDILACSWQSIWNACLKACRDGLLPDGVDGALVPYKGNVTWIPMYAGLLRRFRRSGNFKWITAGVVRQGEVFEHWIDQDGEHFKHVPGDRADAPIIKAYALATTKDGGVFVAVMSAEEIEKIRTMSKATREDSPWRQWYSEMAKKTLLRRLSKTLPSARDLDTEEPPEMDQVAMRNDDANLPRITSTHDALDHFAGEPMKEEKEKEPGPPPPPPPTMHPQTEPEPEPPTPEQRELASPDSITTAHEAGKAAKAAGMQRRAIPGEYRAPDRQREALAWLAGHDGEPVPKWPTSA
jgi:recombination protein RecT